ncbi:hypothetical protein E2493_17470 [Sphingomonas parva]|uniref:Peptidase A2 domain-containing protein n=1 Tax=Sphingomonas parva TaxID=2555898 RepID=A0A4Y8ZLU9_9SPHN|nr:aspartyl protease family protein [Sphingomonas parva]TFI56983.1 hypothetical protein E2493_17470 [Sphingomonas parva]
MRTVSGKLDGGRVIVDVGIQPTLSAPSTAVSSWEMPEIHPYRWLLDTGAQRTCITRSAAKKVGLLPRGKIRLGNIHGVEIHTAYSFAVGFWVSSTGLSQVDAETTYYALDPVMGADLKDMEDFDILIGMDIIARGDLSIRRNGTFEFTLP